MARTGRPLSLDQVYERRPIRDATGQPTGEVRTITRADRMIELIGSGFFVERAARASGIPTRTFYSWTEMVAKATMRVAAGGARLTKNEQALADFLQSVEEAEARWEAQQWLLLERAAQGYTVETVTEKIDPTTGRVTERTVVRKPVEAKLPATFWRLRQRFPDRYKERVEVTGADGGPIMVTDNGVEALDREIDAFLAGAATTGRAQGVPDPRPETHG